MLFPWKRQDMTIFNNNIDLSLSVRRVGLSRLSRWLSLRDRAVLFGIILVMFLPYACSDDPHPLQASQDGSSKYRYAQINITYMDRDKKKEVSSVFQGKYGMNSVIRSASGTVMHAISNHKLRKNHYGCEKYGNQKFPSESWIALVERGECMFTQKIKIATQEHNATAVVIYNNEGEEDTVMDHKSLSSISVFITRDDGFLIADQLDKGISVTMHIWPGGEGTVDNPLQNSISKTSVLFVSISFIVLMIISLAWLVFYYIQRFRYSHAKERLARRLACAAKKAIAKIPQKTVKVGDKELDSEFDQCAVCIEPYKTHDVIRILPCRLY